MEKSFETNFTTIDNPVPYAPVLRFDEKDREVAIEEIKDYKKISMSEQSKPSEERDIKLLRDLYIQTIALTIENGLYSLYPQIPEILDSYKMKYKIMPLYAKSDNKEEETLKLVHIRQKYFTNVIYPYGVASILQGIYKENTYFKGIGSNIFFTPLNEDQTFSWIGFLESLNGYYNKVGPYEQAQTRKILKWKLGDFPVDQVRRKIRE